MNILLNIFANYSTIIFKSTTFYVYSFYIKMIRGFIKPYLLFLPKYMLIYSCCHGFLLYLPIILDIIPHIAN